MSEYLLKYKNVDISYEGQPVVCGAELEIAPGTITAIVGDSGSGKSTLIKASLGLLGNDGRIDGGAILLRDQDLTQLNNRQLRQVRGRQVGMIFQNPGASLCPVRKIGPQFYETIRSHGKLDKRQARREILSLFEQLRLRDGERVLDSYPFELSGGMVQRVAIVLALVLKPELILADEPTSALDVTVQAEVVRMLMHVREIFGTAILMVTHNMGIADHMADRIVVMKQGRLAEQGGNNG